MVLFVEGSERAGKDTQIELLKDHLEKTSYLPTITIHCGKPPKSLSTRDEVMLWSYKQYDSLLKLVTDNIHKYNFILNRSHLGEYVYGGLYRDYDATWMLQDLESTYINESNIDEFRLIVLTADPELMIENEDGDSFFTDLDGARSEVSSFEKLPHVTSADYKFVYYRRHRGQTPEEVFLNICEIL